MPRRLTAAFSALKPVSLAIRPIVVSMVRVGSSTHTGEITLATLPFWPVAASQPR